MWGNASGGELERPADAGCINFVRIENSSIIYGTGSAAVADSTFPVPHGLEPSTEATHSVGQLEYQAAGSCTGGCCCQPSCLPQHAPSATDRGMRWPTNVMGGSSAVPFATSRRKSPIQSKAERELFTVRRSQNQDGKTSIEYECCICSRRCRWRSSITVHIRTHTGRKPYQCRACHQDFADSSTRKKHEKKAHCWKISDNPGRQIPSQLSSQLQFWPCRYCFVVLESNVDLAKHLCDAHGQIGAQGPRQLGPPASNDFRPQCVADAAWQGHSDIVQQPPSCLPDICCAGAASGCDWQPEEEPLDIALPSDTGAGDPSSPTGRDDGCYPDALLVLESDGVKEEPGSQLVNFLSKFYGQTVAQRPPGRGRNVGDDFETRGSIDTAGAAASCLTDISAAESVSGCDWQPVEEQQGIPLPPDWGSADPTSPIGQHGCYRLLESEGVRKLESKNCGGYGQLRANFQ